MLALLKKGIPPGPFVRYDRPAPCTAVFAQGEVAHHAGQGREDPHECALVRVLDTEGLFGETPMPNGTEGIGLVSECV